MDPHVELSSVQASDMDAGLSFPDLPSSSQLKTGSKPRRPPTITPKRFSKFFNPRQGEQRRATASSRSSRRLRDITKCGANRKPRSPQEDEVSVTHPEDHENFTPRRSKRVKFTPVPDSSPLQLLSSPSNRKCRDMHLNSVDLFDDPSQADIMDGLCSDFAQMPTPIRRLRPSKAGRILERSFGGPSVLQRGRSRDPCVDWRHSTASFFSSAGDIYTFGPDSLPFCATTCNSNPLVAFGDEGGHVVVVDSAEDPKVSFAKAHVAFRPHQNAIMDLAFSSDDFLIATASGDQTARVTDMRTQQVRYIMTGHVSSLKSVRFQPGNDSVLATSSRDGSVQLWDLRCRGLDVPPEDLAIYRSSNKTFPGSSSDRQVVYAETCISIRDAHAYGPALSSRRTSADLFANRSQSRADVSITALAFLSDSRPHLLVSASEANATLKLWDVRGKYNRRGPATPLSSTIEPPSHARRRYGMSSLTISGDGSRLYALCRDNAVYAYSTNHLILGHAPELDSRKKEKWRGYASEKEALAPIYALKHPALKVSSFYIKASIRKAEHDREELLAVGSRDGAAIVMPTNEAHFRKRHGNCDDHEAASLPCTPVKKKTKDDDMETYELGTALVRGHKKEVTGLGWTSEGDLVTLSDDYTSRVWREGPKARELRMGGEGEGQRWSCGWADVDASFDEDDV